MNVNHQNQQPIMELCDEVLDLSIGKSDKNEKENVKSNVKVNYGQNVIDHQLPSTSKDDINNNERLFNMFINNHENMSENHDIVTTPPHLRDEMTNPRSIYLSKTFSLESTRSIRFNTETQTSHLPFNFNTLPDYNETQRRMAKIKIKTQERVHRGITRAPSSAQINIRMNRPTNTNIPYHQTPSSNITRCQLNTTNTRMSSTYPLRNIAPQTISEQRSHLSSTNTNLLTGCPLINRTSTIYPTMNLIPITPMTHIPPTYPIQNFIYPTLTMPPLVKTLENDNVMIRPHFHPNLRPFVRGTMSKYNASTTAETVNIKEIATTPIVIIDDDVEMSPNKLCSKNEHNTSAVNVEEIQENCANRLKVDDSTKSTPAEALPIKTCEEGIKILHIATMTIINADTTTTIINKAKETKATDLEQSASSDETKSTTRETEKSVQEETSEETNETSTTNSLAYIHLMKLKRKRRLLARRRKKILRSISYKNKYKKFNIKRKKKKKDYKLCKKIKMKKENKTTDLSLLTQSTNSKRSVPLLPDCLCTTTTTTTTNKQDSSALCIHKIILRGLLYYSTFGSLKLTEKSDVIEKILDDIITDEEETESNALCLNGIKTVNKFIHDYNCDKVKVSTSGAKKRKKKMKNLTLDTYNSSDKNFTSYGTLKRPPTNLNTIENYNENVAKCKKYELMLEKNLERRLFKYIYERFSSKSKIVAYNFIKERDWMNDNFIQDFNESSNYKPIRKFRQCNNQILKLNLKMIKSEHYGNFMLLFLKDLHKVLKLTAPNQIIFNQRIALIYEDIYSFVMKPFVYTSTYNYFITKRRNNNNNQLIRLRYDYNKRNKRNDKRDNVRSKLQRKRVNRNEIVSQNINWPTLNYYEELLNEHYREAPKQISLQETTYDYDIISSPNDTNSSSTNLPSIQSHGTVCMTTNYSPISSYSENSAISPINNVFNTNKKVLNNAHYLPDCVEVTKNADEVVENKRNRADIKESNGKEFNDKQESLKQIPAESVKNSDNVTHDSSANGILEEREEGETEIEIITDDWHKDVRTSDELNVMHDILTVEECTDKISRSVKLACIPEEVRNDDLKNCHRYPENLYSDDNSNGSITDESRATLENDTIDDYVSSSEASIVPNEILESISKLELRSTRIRRGYTTIKKRRGQRNNDYEIDLNPSTLKLANVCGQIIITNQEFNTYKEMLKLNDMISAEEHIEYFKNFKLACSKLRNLSFVTNNNKNT